MDSSSSDEDGDQNFRNGAISTASLARHRTTGLNFRA